MNGERYVRFCIAIEHMAKTLRRYKNEKLSEFGLRGMHLMFLFQLDKEKEGLTVSELAVSCAVDKGFISRATSDLIAKGYVEYKNKVGSRYRNKIILTDLGRHVMDQLNSVIDTTISLVTDEVSAEDFVTFYKVLDSIEKNLEKTAWNEETQTESDPCGERE